MGETKQRRCAGVQVRLLHAAVLCCFIVIASLEGAQPPPITSIGEVLALARTNLAAKPPVHLTAVVTCADKSYSMYFLQDESGGVFLYRHTPPIDLTPGQLVDVKGVAAPGRFAPIIDSARLTLIGNTNLPAAPIVSIANVASGALVGYRVETEAVVQRVEKRGDHLSLLLASGENSCQVWLQEFAGYERLNLLDARVRIPGVVAVAFNKQEQITGFQIFANQLSDIVVIEQPVTDAFRGPVCPTAELWQYTPRRLGEHRVHVRGSVTLNWSNRLTVVQDATGAVAIEGSLPVALKPGDEVDVAGFLAPVKQGPRMRNAEVRVSGAGAMPAALHLDIQEAGSNNLLLVNVMARVVEWQPEMSGEVVAMMQASNVLFAAILPAAGTRRIHEFFPPDSFVSMSGVLKSIGSDGPRLALWLRGPSDILMLREPASPLSRRLNWYLGGALCVFITLLMSLWLYYHHTLAGRVQRERKIQERFEETDRQLRRSHRDREIIGQELHDNIIQSIYSVGLGLDEAQRSASKRPERVAERLNVAIQSLNAVIRDVRQFIVGLEPKGLEGHELKTALKSLLLTSGEDQLARFSIQIDPSAARDLNSVQATEIFSIAREAMSNSMRHAHARLTSVSLVPHGRNVRLEIVDDGTGFDPALVNGSAMGLRNIRNRARNLGGRLEIISSPGDGTRVIMDLPLGNHDSN